MRLIREASSDELLTNAWVTLLRLCEPFLTFDARGEPSAETLAKLEPAAHYTRTAATHHRIDYANVYTTLAGRIHSSRGMASGAGSDYCAAVAAADAELNAASDEPGATPGATTYTRRGYTHKCSHVSGK